MAEALADRRDRFNAVVAGARQAQPEFDVPGLEALLRGPVRTAVEACEARATGSAGRVLAALFEPIVELVGQGRVTRGHGTLLQTLPALAPALTDQPRRAFASLANAIVQLERFAAPVDVWLGRVARAATTGDTETTLRAGQVAAWAVGLAHYRESALATAETLPDEAMAAALGVADPMPTGATVARLRADRWWRPDRDPPAAGSVVHRVGGFRGFGGPFLEPPAVVTTDGRVAVRCRRRRLGAARGRVGRDADAAG